MLPPGRAKLATMPLSTGLPKDPDDRNCGCCRFEIEGEVVVADGNDHIRIAAHDVASQVWIM